MSTSIVPDSGQTSHIVQNGARESATSVATREALTRIAQTGQAAPTPVAAPVAPPAAPAPEGQVRASDGTFAPPVPPVPPVDPNAAPVAAPADGLTPPAADPNAPVVEATPEEIAAQARSVELAMENGEIVDLMLPDDATAAIVREALDAAARAPEIQREAERAINETQELREYAEVDPVGFVQAALGDSIEGREHLALTLLTDPEVWARLKPVVAKLADPVQFESVANREKARRVEFRQQAEQQITEGRAVRENLVQLQTACASVLPKTMTPAQQQIAYADMMRDLQHYATRANVSTINPADLHLILANRLTALGVDPAVAARQMQSAITARSARTPRTPAAATRRPTPAPAAAAAPPAPPRNGAAFVAGQQRRQAAASIPPAGAGSPTSVGDLQLPKNPDGSSMNSAQALAWHRQQNANNRRFLTPAT